MAVKVMQRVWEHADIQGNDLLVLLALADWANDDGLCWPSIPRIATKARVSVRTAQYTIRRLVARGYVTLEPGGGRRHPNRYMVQMPPPAPPETVQPAHPSQPQSPHMPHPSRGATASANGAATAQNGAATLAPEPLQEPSREPSREPSGKVAPHVTFPPVAPSPAIPATPTPAEVTWHAINHALDHWAPGADPPPLDPDAQAVIAALGGLATLSACRPQWPAVLRAYNLLHRDAAPTRGTGP